MRGFRNIKLIISIIMIFLFIAVPISDTIINYSNEKVIEITIKDKYVKGQEGRYFIVDTDNNTYIIADLLLKNKFNSSDLYSKLEIGNKYKVETTGMRIHFLSKYQNINKIIAEERWILKLENM